MTQMNFGLHHLFQRAGSIEKKEFEQNEPLKSFINKFIYFVGGFGAAVIIPQVTRVWFSKDVEGVSLTTWAGFFIASIFWLIYGLVHREKAIIYTNLVVSVLDFFIVLGIVLHRFQLLN
jgi:MtN3 and saliva related transmembrane protein